MKLYLVWNSAMNECVGFTDYADAFWTANGVWPSGYHSAFLPTVGDLFRENYAEECHKLPMTTMEIPTNA